MPQATRLAALLRDLQQLEKAAAPHHGQLILDAFCRHTPHAAGAVWLRDARTSPLQLAACTPAFPADEPGEVPLDVSALADRLLVPIRSQREALGLIALANGREEADAEMLRAATAFLAAIIGNHRLAQEMREGDFQLKYRLWELEALYDIGLSIASTLNMDDLADEILARMISLINARRAGLFLREGDRFRLFRSFGEIGLSEDDLVGIVTAHSPVTLEDGALAALPIVGDNSTIGVLAIGDRETRDGVGPFEQNDLRLLSLFASQVAIALENARLHKEALEKQAMQRDLELAATIQGAILPKSIPEVEGIEIATLARPARQVGGDYHAFVQREDVLTLIVADVSGKSMPAALLVSALHATVQLLFAEGRKLGEIATELNRHIHNWSADNKFVTMVMASIDRDAGTIEYVNAGHNPCYIITPGSTELMRSHGLPIGIMGNSRYLSQTRPFPTGSVVVLYSDGITEAVDTEEQEFGNERLESVMKASLEGGASAMRDAIAEAVDGFTVGAAQYDDQTLVVARVFA